MRKLLKELKKYWYMLLLIIILLFAQANVDLLLPQYMADLVSVGISNKGIEESVPAELSEQGYFALEHELGAPMVDKYYEKEEQKILLKNEIDDEDEESFKRAMGRIVLSFDKQMGFTPDDYDKLPSTIQDSLPTEFIKAQYQELGMDLDEVQMDYVISQGLKMLAITLLSVFLIIAVSYISAKLSGNFSRDLRRQIVEKVFSFSLAEKSEFATSSLIIRSTDDVDNISNMMMTALRLVFYAPILAIGGIIKVVQLNPSMSWIIVAAVAVIIILFAVVFSMVVPRFKILQKTMDAVSNATREALSGLIVTRSFNKESYQEKRFEKVNRRLRDLFYFVHTTMAFVIPFIFLIMNITVLALLYVGAKQIDISALRVGDLMAFIQYTTQIVMSFIMMSMLTFMYPRASVSADRIAEVLQTKTKIIDPKNPKELTFKDEIAFYNVGFGYPGAQGKVLENINFQIKKGQTIGVIGGTGSGKSTLIALMDRLFDVSAGKITIDGVDIREVKLEKLRDMISYTPQKTNLFSGTIRENLEFAQEVDDQKLEEIMSVSQADVIVNTKENGLEEHVARGGTNFSGGQKQRLAIARSLLKDASIFIFDDSFSALDYKTESKLRKSLREQAADRTFIIVTQRLKSIVDADKILVLERGTIDGFGTHEELSKTSKIYQELMHLQGVN